MGALLGLEVGVDVIGNLLGLAEGLKLGLADGLAVGVKAIGYILGLEDGCKRQKKKNLT